MRELVIKKSAFESIELLVDYLIEVVKMPNTARGYALKMIAFAESLSENPFAHAICRQYRLSKKNLRCAVFDKKWIFVYSVNETHVIIKDIIWGAKLS